MEVIFNIAKQIFGWINCKINSITSRRAKRMRRIPVFEELEPRILLSTFTVAPTADADDVAITQPIELSNNDLDAEIINATEQADSDQYYYKDDSDATISNLTVTSNASSHTAVTNEQNSEESLYERKELVFVDTSVKDYQVLLSGISQNAEVYLLDATQDGVEQIANLLQGQENIDAIHVISYGSQAELLLGTSTLNADSMTGEYVDELALINQALNEEADLLIYGCNFGQGEIGQATAQTLASLTGADIAASVDLTGAQELGGDWDLELQIGAVESSVVVNDLAQQEFAGVLDITTGLQGHWTFDADATDSSGNNYNGILMNGASVDTSNSTDIIGEGKLSLDGSNDYVDLSSHASGVGGFTEGTIAAWIKTPLLSEIRTIFGVSDTSTFNSSRATFSVNHFGEVFFLVQDNGTPLLDVGLNYAIDDNQWHHVVITVDSSGNALYVDGVKVPAGNLIYYTGSASTTAFFDDVHDGGDLNSMRIGADEINSGFTRMFEGLTDDVRLYNRALTASDIDELFATSRPLIIDTTNDVLDGDTSSISALVSNKGADGFISLREAIIASNNTVGTDTINFNIGLSDSGHVYYQDDGIADSLSNIVTTSLDDGSIVDFDTDYVGTPFSWWRIQLTSVLPDITDTVIIDGTTQSGWQAGQPVIEINGALAGTGVDVNGLTVSSGGASSSISGLVINEFDWTGIQLVTGGGNTITGNFIGTDVTGTVDLGNRINGIEARSSNNIIGGNTLAERNVIAGNAQGNISLGTLNTGNIVQGNYLGTEVTGTSALGGSYGLRIYGDNNQIGGTGAGEENVISYVRIDSGGENNVLEGNLIGTDASGTSSLGGTYGVVVYGANNIIGGTTTDAGNVISGNSSIGVWLSSTSSLGNQIQGNLIGTDITGTVALGNGDGVRISSGASNNVIGGTTTSARNIISGNTSDGIQISNAGTTGNLIQGNYIGTDISGLNYLGNTLNGVLIELGASGNTIGGMLVGAGNLISGNGEDGIEINDAQNNFIQNNIIGLNGLGNGVIDNSQEGIQLLNNTSNTTIVGNTVSGNAGEGIVITGTSAGTVLQGNLIGTDTSGAAAYGNASNGVLVSADDVTIGGMLAIERNIISGNTFDGINISSASNTVVQGNYIGTDITGTVDLGNGEEGISLVNATNALIGGSIVGARNVISGNNRSGIYDNFSTGTTVLGNYIGVDASGSSTLGNSNHGISAWITSDITIGGTGANDHNVIGGNSLQGILLYSTGGHTIQGNYIGTDEIGSIDLGNLQHGVVTSTGSSNNLIGGVSVGEGNVIAFNTLDGIAIGAGSSNSILGNQTYSNNGLGIDLSGGVETVDGVTANDTGDADTGANNLQNYPLLISAATDGSANVQINGSINTEASTTYRIEFFVNSGIAGEALRYIGFATVTTDVNGDATISANLSAVVAVGEHITATATVDLGGGMYGDTSEFATNVEATLSFPEIDLDPNDTSVAADPNYVTEFTENGGAITVADINATLSDLDSTNLVSLIVTLTNPLNSTSEVLSANTSGTLISSSYNSATGELTLTGTDTVTNYQQVLRTITYNNLSEDPDTTVRTLTFVANDGTNNSNTAVTAITINAINDEQSLDINTGLVLPERTQATITNLTLSTSDVDNESSEIVYTITADSVHGTIRLGVTALGVGSTFTQADIDAGLVSYEDTDIETSSDSFSFSVDDGVGAAQLSTFNITVTPVNNNDPVANNDNITVAEGGTATVLDSTQNSVLANDTDADLPNDSLSVVVNSGPSHGALTLNADGTFSYTHNDSENFVDSFTYDVMDADGGVVSTGTVNIVITPVNDNDPVANNDNDHGSRRWHSKRY